MITMPVTQQDCEIIAAFYQSQPEIAGNWQKKANELKKMYSWEIIGKISTLQEELKKNLLVRVGNCHSITHLNDIEKEAHAYKESGYITDGALSDIVEAMAVKREGKNKKPECGYCGSVTVYTAAFESYQCSKCGRTYYPNEGDILKDGVLNHAD